MVERHELVFEWSWLRCQFTPTGCTIQLCGSVQVWHQHSCGEAGYLLAQCLHPPSYVECLPAIAVAIDCEEDGRFQLGEPIPHGTCPEVRGAGRPRRAQARCGEKGRNRLNTVGERGNPPVPEPPPEPTQAVAYRAYQVSQLAVGEEPFQPVFADEHYGK